MKNLTTSISLGILGLASVSTSQAAFMVLDNFESAALNSDLHGRIAPGSGTAWVTNVNGATATPSTTIDVVVDPADSGNKAVIFTTAQNHIAYNNLGVALTTGESSTVGAATGTLFFRIRLAPQRQNYGVGWSDGGSQITGASTTAPSSNNFNNFEALINSDGSTDTVRARNGTGWTTPVASADDVWYNVWFVAKNNTGRNANDTYDAYIQGGAFATQTSLGTSLQFRANTATDELGGDPLDYFLMRQGGAVTAGGTAGAFYVDDIYVDTAGQNLINPVPEPSFAVLLLGSIGSLMLRRRRD